MDGLDGNHIVTPTVTSRNRGAVFSVRGRCRSFVNTYGKPFTRLGDLKT
jgi:hypothetical protein